MNVSCFCRLTNGNIYILNRGRVVTFHKEKATGKFVLVHGIVQDKYECPLDQILPEIEEAFDLRFKACGDIYGTGYAERFCEKYEDYVIFNDSSFNDHKGWVLEDRDTIIRKMYYSELQELVVYKDTYIINGKILEQEKVERIVLNKEDWLSLYKKYDRSIL